MYWSTLLFVIAFLAYFFFAGKVIDIVETSERTRAKLLGLAVAELGFWSLGIGVTVAACFGAVGLFSTSAFLSIGAWIRCTFYLLFFLLWLKLFWFRLTHRWRWPEKL